MLQRCSSWCAILAGLSWLGGCAGDPSQPAPTPTSEAAPPADTPHGQLPRTVVPRRYVLELQVVPEQPEFGGEVAIDVEFTSATDRVWLHGQDLRVEAASVSSAGATVAARYEQVTPEGVALLHLERSVAAGPATLRLRWRAPFNNQLEGLYRVRADDRWYAFTQFEAISARKCFPGFDEPAFKTPFEVSVVAPAGQAALANTPEVAVEPAGDGLSRHRFATSQPLPSYLVALTVGPLDVVAGPDVPANAARATPLPLRGVAVAGRGPELAYALRHTGAILAALESYTGIAYPYEKLDIVAVPDFAAGAMENAGLVTFREWLLLLGDAAPAHQKRSFVAVVAHELAHQWFGNLVTMPWWDDIWLNEAFASWMETGAVAAVEPSYRPEVTLVQDTQRAFEQDSLGASRSIRQPIESNHDIHNAFDAITYDKGAAVLAMFERFLGAGPFQAGVRRYLTRHAHGNATYRDFLSAVAEGAGTDVTAAFESFLQQPGVPLVTVTPACEGGRPSVRLTQRRWLPIGSRGDAARTWQVPVCLSYGGDAGAGPAAPGKGSRAGEPGAAAATRQKCVLLSTAEETVPLEGACPAWVLPNHEAAGYYRWSLPPAELTRLREVAFAALSPRDLLSLADAVRAGFAAGTVSAGEALAFAEQLAAHPERAVATSLMGLVRFCQEQVAGDAERPAVEAYARRVFAGALQRVGAAAPADARAAAAESSEVRLFRRELIDFLADVGHDSGVREALRRRVPQLLAAGGGADAELLETALTVAVQDGDTELAARLAGGFGDEHDPDRRRSILGALSRAEDPATIERVRQLTLAPAVRSNEVLTLLSGMLSRPAQRRANWDWITSSFASLAARLPEAGLGRLPQLGQCFCGAADAEALRTFFTPKVAALPGGPRNLANAIEAVELCAAKAAAHQQAARQFFAAAAARPGGAPATP